jgi:photosystem II stability/assembly factor-like uncharacterized protein
MDLSSAALLCAFFTLGSGLGPAAVQEPEEPVGSGDLLAAWEQREALRAASPFHGLRWEAIGPSFQGGRIETIAGVPGRPRELWAGAGSGGLWKSTDSGVTWEAMLDDHSTCSIGAVAVAPSDPDVVWVGSGENLRAGGYTLPGTGVFRTEDGGRTWRNVGLHDSNHIGAIAVHPTDPDTAWVAAMGPFYSRGGQRGVFRTRDGGASWERVLAPEGRSWAFDVAVDPADPSTLYATTWSLRFDPGGGIHRSTDGGTSWRRLTQGLPVERGLGRIELDVSRSDPRVVYALVQSRAGGAEPTTELYRSDDRGETWARRNVEELQGFSWALGDVRVAPHDPEEVWLLGVRLLHSTDGGRTTRWIGGEIVHLQPSRAETLHLDHCDLWIDPTDPARLALGNDGGVYLSWDRGATWLHRNSLPIGEVYDLTVEGGPREHVFLGTQDTAASHGPIRPLRRGLDAGWEYVWLDPWSGGDGFVTWPDPTDPDTVYWESQQGHLVRKDLATGATRRIRPRPEEGADELRCNWYTPYLLSPHDPSTLYFGAQRVWRSTDRGDSWEALGPDLTRSEEEGRKSHALSALAESSLRAGLLWAGTERGIVQRSEDGGVTWVDVSSGLPVRHVKRVVPSRHAESRAYVTQTGIDQDDFTPRVHVSEDGGATWRDLSAGLPPGCANVLCEDPADERLLYLGTTQGVFVSLDRGESWAALCEGLPCVSVEDLELHPERPLLVAGTHGRSAYALDIAPLRELLAEDLADAELHLFDLAAALLPWPRDDRNDLDLATRVDALVSWWSDGAQPVRVTIEDPDGDVLYTHDAPARRGIGRVPWDLTVGDREEQGVYFIPGRVHVAPGLYPVRVVAGETEVEGSLPVGSVSGRRGERRRRPR